MEKKLLPQISGRSLQEILQSTLSNITRKADIRVEIPGETPEEILGCTSKETTREPLEKIPVEASVAIPRESLGKKDREKSLREILEETLEYQKFLEEFLKNVRG